MASRLRLAAIVGAAALAYSATAAAGGYEDDTRQAIRADFTATKPGAPSGVNLSIEYFNPVDPEAKPPAIRKVEIILARRSRIDTDALPACDATDAELIAVGPSACPPESYIGPGLAVVDTGLPGFRGTVADIEFFNNDDELIFLNTVRGVGLRVVTRSVISGRRLTTEPGFLPGTPPEGGAIKAFEAHYAPISRVVDGARHHYYTTPTSCPRSGYWTHKMKFTYSDGETQIARDRDRCRGES